MLTELDIINTMLASTGIQRLTAADSSHPLYIQAAEKIADVKYDALGRGWWFNTITLTLNPDVNGRIVLPSNALSVDPTDTTLAYTMRGSVLWDMTNNTDNIGSAVECRVVYDTPINELPPAAASYLKSSARYEYYLDANGNQAKLQHYMNAALSAWARLRTEDLKNLDLNALSGRAAINWRRARPHRQG